MSAVSIHGVQLIVLLLLLFVAAFSALAHRFKTPYPIVLVIAGVMLGFVPGIPRITLEPDLIFLVVLPPLLYAAAAVTSWRDFSYNFVSVGMLAFGLVGFTVVSVAVAGPLLISGLDWRVGCVLGAAVCTTDAIAATSIAKRIGLPKRIVDLLEGESLLNDATGLLALEFATMMVVDHQTPTVVSGILRLSYLSFAGVAIGLILALIVEWVEHRIDDGPIEIALSILVSYSAYLTAEAVHASGVLAVVAAGLYLGRKSSKFLSPAVRLQSRAVWDLMTFILYGILFSVFLVLLRILWTFPGAYVAYFIRTRLLRQDEKRPEVGQIFVVGWTGMRGVIALAAAISLPDTIGDGSPFPDRDLIIFLTFCVILVTLVFQGLTLPPLVRLLGLAENPAAKQEAQKARRLVLESALTRLEDLRLNDPSGSVDLYDDLAQHYKHRLASIGEASHEQDKTDAEQHFRYLELSRRMLAVERHAALRMRDEGRIADEALRELEHELDLSEARLAAAISHQIT